MFGREARANAVTAASCNESDVSAALAKAANGDTVLVPAGNCVWTTTLNYSAPGSISIIGAGNQSVVGGGDVTVITDSVSHTPTDNATLAITTGSASSVFRLSGITFRQVAGSSSTGTFNGVVRISGNSQNVRVDHMHFLNVYCVGVDIDGWMYGVFDHNLFDLVAGSVNNGVRVGHTTWNGDQFGDGSWADSTTFGSNRFIYFENNTFNGGAADDCNNGGRVVFRNNVLNESFFQGHEMEDRNRGCRAVEVYNNTFSNSTSIVEDGQDVDFRMGTGLVWGNVSTGAPQLVIFNNDRTNSGHGFAAPPNGWGYCGTALGPSGWDQNSTSSGYACFDQVGRGKGGLLPQSYWPLTASWPGDALEPVYEWLDQWNAVSGYPYTSPCNTNDSTTIAQNRDFYCYTKVWNGSSFAGTAFNGTSGVGSGVLSTRPSTCTLNVAYWATDTSTLYQCSATNTWTTYYTPYTYPHPLTLGSASSNPPVAPTDLAANVN